MSEPNFCTCRSRPDCATLAVPALGVRFRMLPLTENGVCAGCGLPRPCKFCGEPSSNAAHNTMDMHVDGATGGTGCPTVREKGSDV